MMSLHINLADADQIENLYATAQGETTNADELKNLEKVYDDVVKTAEAIEKTC